MTYWVWPFSFSRIACSLIFLFSFHFSASSVQATLLEELAERAGDALVLPREAALADYPANELKAGEPRRSVAQWVEGTFLHWEEVAVVDGKSAEPRTAIRLLIPEERGLSAEEARVLWGLSASWRAGEPSAAPQMGEPDTAAPAEKGATEKVVLGGDDRTKVANYTAYPNNIASYLNFYFPAAGNYRASGGMVGPRVLLTASHCVWHTDTQEYIKSMTISPGMGFDAAQEQTVLPYGSQSAIEFRSTVPYLATGDSAWDFAACFTARPFDGLKTFPPVVFNAQPTSIRVVGYPFQTPVGVSFEMWEAKGQVVSIRNGRVYHTADSTGGSSGSLMWNDNGPNGPEIIGVHTSGGATDNRGVWFNDANKSVILEWMQYQPNSAPLVSAAWAAPDSHVPYEISEVLIEGVAFDAEANLAKVQWRVVGEKTWKQAEGTELFQFVLRDLAVGLTKVEVQAVDREGLVSDIFIGQVTRDSATRKDMALDAILGKRPADVDQMDVNGTGIVGIGDVITLL